MVVPGEADISMVENVHITYRFSVIQIFPLQ